MFLYTGRMDLNGKTVSVYNATNQTGDLNVLGTFHIEGSGNLNVYNHINTSSATCSGEALKFTGTPTHHIYNDYLQMNNATAAFYGEGATIILDGDFIMSTGVFEAPTACFSIGGDWNRTAGTYTDNGTIKFIGQDATFYSSETFANVVMAKDSGYSLTIDYNGDIVVTSSLTLTSGVFNTTLAGSLSTLCGVALTANTDCDNPISYVNGPITRSLCSTSPTTLLFPIGKSGNYRPMWLEPEQTTTEPVTYTAEQFEGLPPNHCVPSDITCVSKVRWYRVFRGCNCHDINPITTVDPIKLTYCSDDGVSNPDNLRVVMEEEGCWKNIGGTGTGANKGTISSDVKFDEYSDIVLANDTNCFNPLPVALSSFTGTYRGEVEYLNWTTASEINNSHFEILRSFDGSNWNKIGEVKGAGNAQSNKYYSFQDHNLPEGSSLVFYRLRQVDFDGAFELSKIIVEDLSLAGTGGPGMKVFPNPAKDLIVIETRSRTNEHFVVLTDMIGRVVYEQSFDDVIEINTSLFPTGVYTISLVELSGGQTSHSKIQISRD